MPSNISNFGKFFVAEHTNLFLGLSIAIPIAIEVIQLARRIYRDPGMPLRALKNVVQLTRDSFTRKEGEGYGRIAFNVMRVAFFGTILAAAIAMPFILFPPTFAIPIALMAIFAVGKLIKNREAFYTRIGHVVDWFRCGFVRNPKETRKEAIKRIAKNILFLLSVAAVVTGVVMASIYASQVLSVISSPYQFVHFLPAQTTAVVFTEYGLVGAAHAALGVRAYKKGDKKNALYHAISAIATVVFPLFYFFKTPDEMRLHHSFIGLALGLLPFRTTRIFGAFVTLDAGMYMLSKQRGYMSGGRFHSSDFMNIVVDNWPLYFNMLTATILAQLTFDRKEDEKRRQFREKQVEESIAV